VSERVDQPKSSLVIAAAVASTVSTVFPGFLVGAISVQASEEFGVGEARYGWALGTFFLAAALTSTKVGQIAQRIGPRRQMTAALAGTAVTQLAIAALARSFALLLVGLAIAGCLNAANQTAVNLALTRAKLPRLGLAISIKQSGMPAASMLAGLAVPGLALTLGWRWGYISGAVVASIACMVVWRWVPGESVEAVRDADSGRSEATPHHGSLVTRRNVLVVVSIGAMFLAFTGGALSAWTVASGVNAGLGEGTAGLLLSAGALTGITMRLISGSRLDAMRRKPFLVGGCTVFGGAIGLAFLSLRIPWVHALATLLSFGSGWIWPVFTNFGIVRTNADAASTATGITQTGVFAGVFMGPLVTGWVVDTWGYSPMWLVTAASAIVGAFLTIAVRDHF